MQPQSLPNPAVVTLRPLAIEISDKLGELGRTVEVKNRRANVQVAIDADDLRFRDVFMTALGKCEDRLPAVRFFGLQHLECPPEGGPGPHPKNIFYFFEE